MRNVLFGTRRRTAISTTALVVVVLLIAGMVWAVIWVADNINAPGPPPTGSGPCGSADSVNIQLVFADGHTVQACTRDRPACPNQTITGSGNGQTSSVSQFGLSNQLRSASRRYIFSLSLDAALPAEAAEQTLRIDPGAFLPGPPGLGSSSNGTLSAAVVHVTPRDPYEDGYIPGSGSVTVSSSQGVARGSIDGTFSVGEPTRSPIRITGTFTCNR